MSQSETTAPEVHRRDQSQEDTSSITGEGALEVTQQSVTSRTIPENSPQKKPAEPENPSVRPLDKPKSPPDSKPSEQQRKQEEKPTIPEIPPEEKHNTPKQKPEGNPQANLNKPKIESPDTTLLKAAPVDPQSEIIYPSVATLCGGETKPIVDKEVIDKKGKTQTPTSKGQGSVEITTIKSDTTDSGVLNKDITSVVAESPEAQSAGPKRLFKKGRRAAPTRRLDLTGSAMSAPEPAAPKPSTESPVASAAVTSNSDEARRRSSVRKPLMDVVYSDDGYFDELEDSGEPSQAAEALMKVLRAVAGVVMRFLCFLLSALGGAMPLMLQVTVFATTIYVLAEYAVSPAEPRQVADFPSRLRYIVRGQAWLLLPCILSYAVSRWKPTDVHRRFAEESFRQLALLTTTLIVRCTHASDQEFHWIWVFTVVTALYSWSYWLALSYGRPWMRRALSYPPLVVTLALMICSFCCIVKQDLGFGAPSIVSHRDEDDRPGYWKYTSMCHMIERAFCSIDGELPRMQY